MAAYRASRTLSVPFLTYLMDDWVWGAGRRSFVHASIVRRVFPKILERSAKVWAISEFMAEQLASRYGVASTVLPPPVDVDRYQLAKRVSEGSVARNGVSIVYTGAVYAAQADAIVNFLRALESVAWKVVGYAVEYHRPTQAARPA